MIWKVTGIAAGVAMLISAYVVWAYEVWQNL